MGEKRFGGEAIWTKLSECWSEDSSQFEGMKAIITAIETWKKGESTVVDQAGAYLLVMEC